MSGFLSSDTITSIRSKFSTLHTTFARDIVVFKVSKQEVIVSTNTKYNPIYGRTNQGRKVEQETVVSQTFKARIYYVDSDQEEITEAQDKVFLPKGSIKIIVDETAYTYIREAKNITFDENKFSIASQASPYGFTDNQFFIFYLVPLDEI
jgi:hypothetical protein